MSTPDAGPRRDPAPPDPPHRRLVVIGNGMAGARTVDEILFRNGGERFDITMFGDEPYGNYNRILLSGVLAGQDAPEDIFINPLAWYEEKGIELRAGVRVERIDRAARVVHDSEGGVTPYDQLIIATGSRSFVPPVEGVTDMSGALSDGVFVFRTLDDCAAMTERARGSSRAAVIGGGLLGLEAARGLMAHGLEVEVVEAAPHLMAQQIDPEGAAILEGTIREMGIDVRAGAFTSEIVHRDGRLAGMRFADGTEIACDMVVVAAGIRPNAEIAADAGLAVDRAIVVDDRMRTADPDVWAVGEVAQHRGVVYGLVAPLWEQAHVLADNITGVDEESTYEGSKLATKLKVMGVELAVMGEKASTVAGDEVLRFSDPARGVYKQAIVRDGALAGATLLGDVGKVSFLTQAFDRGTPVPDDRLELLFDLGEPAPAGSELDDLPADATVCGCNGVSKGAIAACVAGGTRDAAGVMAATRAGTGCGSCKQEVARVVAWAGGEGADEAASPARTAPATPTGDPVTDARERGRRSAADLFDAIADMVGAAFGGGATSPPPAAAAPASPAPDEIAALPDDAQICNCNGVSKGDITACVAAGTRSVAGVVKSTRAGAGCGSCTSRVAQIVEWAAGGRMVDDPAAHHYVPGVPLSKPELVEEIRSRGLRSVSEVFDALADGRDDPGSKMGLTSLLRSIWGRDDLGDERDARFINDRVHANIQKDGTFSVVPGISGGVTNADQLRRIADVADRYDVPMIKITGGQRIDLLGVTKEDLPSVWRDLGMRSGYAYGKSMRTVKTCVGAEFCRFGLGDSTSLGIAMEERFKGLESPAKLKLAVAGCPRNCSEALVKDLGVVAVDGGRWEIYVGGAAGATVRKGDLLCTVDSPEEVMLLSGRFIQFYRENARWLERTYDFVPRVGVDNLRAIVVDDVDDDAARLDAEMERSVADYRDPWLEGDDPATVNQFASDLEKEAA